MAGADMKAHTGAPTSDRKSTGILAHDEIAERAYEIFLARGSVEGHALDDWLEAERMLMRHLSKRRRPDKEPQ